MVDKTTLKNSDEHKAAIRAVLSAIPADFLPAQAILVVEDAMVALQLGLTFGLEMPAIQRLSDEAGLSPVGLSIGNCVSCDNYVRGGFEAIKLYEGTEADQKKIDAALDDITQRHFELGHPEDDEA